MTDKNKVTEINFGKSQWEQNQRDSENYSDTIIKIPSEGRLPDFNFEQINNYNQVMECESKKDGMVVRINKPRAGMYDHDYEAILLWIEERVEWVLIWHETWTEGGAMWDDDSYSGPFAINELCASKILEAYDIFAKEIKIEEVLHTSPVELEKFTSEK